MGYRNYATANGFIVAKDGNGDFSTIGAALTAATSGTTIFIRPGTYTENPTLKAGVNLTAYDCDATTPNVTILGKCQASFAGTCSISGIQLQTNGDFCLAVTGSAVTVIWLNHCYINATNNTAISYTSSMDGSVILNQCNGNLATTGIAYFSHSSAGALQFYTGIYGNGGASTTASTNSSSTAGSCAFRNCYWGNAITTSNSSQFIAVATEFQAPLIIGGTGSNTIGECTLEGATSSALSIGASANVIITNCSVSSSNTNAITGTGTLTYGGLVFSGSSSQVSSGLTLALSGSTPSNAASGKVWTSTGTNTSPTWQTASGGIASVAVQTFTSSGTYTPTTGMLYCTIECVGGGGGGGATTSTGTGTVTCAGGGGGGGYARKTVAAATIGASQTVTIGAAGAAGAAAGGTGGTGGTTSVGSICVAAGGVGGSGGVANTATQGYTIPGGAGGAGSTGDILSTGQGGGAGVATGTFYSVGGAGGSSYFGGGASAATAAGVATQNAGTAYGGGGSGCATGGGGNSQGNGGAGFKGFVIITEYV